MRNKHAITVKKWRRAPFSHGFTLAEVMIAVAVFGLVAGGLIGTMIMSKYSARMAQNRVVAMNLVAARLEEVGSWPDSALIYATGVSPLTETTLVPPGASSIVADLAFDPAFKNRFINRTTTIALAYLFSTPTATPGVKVYQVNVTVNWMERALGSDRTMNETASTYVLPIR